ncbi:hypothetical protein L596_000901 [Steinernema carpocapsae]|uniref:Uncharacterized protein n=1 Tax=Steinernema carpocapsae TaxID=34508 RepID=A0A4U8ULS6_STECR|nr:hypothetical protein L596_000901 [Steinernema carpocapsae]
MYTISTNNVGKLSRKDKQNKLILACSLKADQATSLLDILEPSEKIKVNPALRAVQKNRNEAIGNLSKKAFLELEGIARTFHLLCNEKQAKSITFDPMLCYRPDLFSDGFVFQLEITVPRSGGKEVIMPILAGGRYDKSLAAEHHASDPQSPAPISAIGFNLYVDTLANVAALLEAEIPVRMNSCSAIVCCSEGSLEKEKFQLAQKLRKHGIATDVLHEVVSNVDSLRDHCVAQKIGHLLVIKEEGVVLVVDPSEQKDNGVKLHVDEAILKVSSAGAPTSSRLRTADVPTSSPARQSTAFSATFSNVVWLHSSKKSSSERRKIEGQIQNHATAKDVVAYVLRQTEDLRVHLRTPRRRASHLRQQDGPQPDTARIGGRLQREREAEAGGKRHLQ